MPPYKRSCPEWTATRSTVGVAASRFAPGSKLSATEVCCCRPSRRAGGSTRRPALRRSGVRRGGSLRASVRNAASGSLAGASSATSCCASRSVPRRHRRGDSPRNTCPGRVRTLRFQSRTGHPDLCAPCRGMVERSRRRPQLQPSRSQGAADRESDPRLIVFGVRHLHAIPRR